MVIQVACTLVTYFCWFNKPLDVGEPTVIKLQPPGAPQTSQTKEVGGGWGGGAVQGRPLSRDPTIYKRCPSNHISIIANACYDIIVYVDAEGNTAADASTVEAVPAASDAEASSRRRTSRLAPMLMEGFIVSTVGLLHAAAWNSHFPTPLERLLWRIASIGMCVFPLVIVTVTSWTQYQQDLTDVLWDVHLKHYSISEFHAEVPKMIWQVASKHGKTPSTKLAHVCLILFCLFILLAYLLCIIYITAESYASVRDPPAGTMITPLWSSYWPHAQ